MLQHSKSLEQILNPKIKMTKIIKLQYQNIIIFTFLIVLLSNLSVEAAIKIWSPQSPRPTAATPNNVNLWSDPNNWIPVGVPTNTDDVIIPSGSNTCYIDAIFLFTPTCNSLTIQGDAAVYNRSSLADIGGALTVEEDLIIENGGFYFGEAKILSIGRDLIIRGSFIILDNTNEIRIGRNYWNQGTLAKKQIAATFMNFTFNTNQDGFIYASGVHNNTNNTFVQEDLSGRVGFNFGYLIAGATPYNILKTGAFDNVIVNKIQATLQNSGFPLGVSPSFIPNTTNVLLPFFSGIVGDGANDFDGIGGVDEEGALYSISSGVFEIQAGSVIVNNVTGITPETITVYDGSTTHPQSGLAWEIPPADINIRNDLIISDANFGLGSYNAASLDLYTATIKRDICLHLGGSLEDRNRVEPSNTASQRRGFYIGPIDQLFNATAYQDRPVVVFNGNDGQDINGLCENIRDFNNIANQGRGMVLPNVIIHKPTTERVTIGSGTNIRILGDLTMFSGELNVNGRNLLFGDSYTDEINVMSVGNSANLNPDAYAILRLNLGGKILMSTINDQSINTDLASNDDTGSFLRGRRGSQVILEGTATEPVEVTRDSPPGGRIRISFYSGANLRARYCNFSFPSKRNDNYALVGTNAPTNNTTGGAGSNGGLKIYEGVVLYDYNTNLWDPAPASASATAIHSLSNCLLAGANTTTILTVNTEGFYRFFATQFSDNYNDNKSCVSQKSTGQLLFVESTGTAGARLGEVKDGGTAEGTGTGIFPADRIIWENPPLAVWRGNVGAGGNLWSNPANWIIPDQPGGCSGCGPTYNPDNLVPGVSITDIDVTIPKRAINPNCVADVDFTINGSLTMEPRNTTSIPNLPSTTEPAAYLAGSEKFLLTLTINPSINAVVQKDLLLYWNNRFNMLSDSRLELGGNLMANFSYISAVGTSLTQAVSMTISDGATIELTGTASQQISIRHNFIRNFIVNKPSGTAFLQGVTIANDASGNFSEETNWTFRTSGNFQIKRGNVRLLSNTRLDILRDYIQEDGLFEPLNSEITLRGNYTGTGGTMRAGGSYWRFYPVNKAITPSTTQVDWNITTTNNHIFNDVVIGDTTLFENYEGNGVLLFPSNTDRVTHSLQSPLLNILGDLTIQANRTLIIKGKQLRATDLALEGTAQLDLNSTTISPGELFIASGGSIDIGTDARFNMIGLSTQYVKLGRSDVLGRYSFTMNGTISARYYIAEYMDDNGIYLTSTARSVSPGVISVGGGGQNYVSPTVSFFSTEGSGATATVNVLGSNLDFISVTNSGTGYTTPPTVNFSSGTAAADAVLTGSPISNVTLTNAGTGYTSTPTITVDNTGTGGAGLVVNPIMQPSEVIGFSGVSGTNYIKPPLVIIGGPGTGASAQAVLAPSALQLQTFTMNNVGSGYTTGTYSGATYVQIQGFGGSGSGAVGEMTVNASGQVTQVEITNGGGGYVFPITVDIVGGGGTGAEVNISNLLVTATNLTSIDVIAGGTGYSSAPPITFDNTGAGGTDAVATASVSAGGGSVIGLDIVNAGSGYLSAPTLTFTGGSPATIATATASTLGGRVTAVNITTNDSYINLPTISFTGGGGTGATAEAFGKGGSVSTFTITTPGSGYRTAPVVSVIGNGSGASARAKITASPVVQINVLNGGDSYTSTPTITLTSANGDGTASFVVPPGDIVMSGVAPNMSVDVINVPPGGYGTGYTTAPNVEITGGGGSGASVRPLLNPGQVTSIDITPELKYPVASFSDGIFTNTAYGATAAALTIDGNYSTYRTKANTNTDPDNLVGGLAPDAAGVTIAMHDYGNATFANGTGPRIDTVYNVVFAKNPAVDVSGDYTLSNNVRRIGSNNDPTHRIVFKDALGTFSGEDFDGEEAITTVPAGTVDILITPDPIATDTKINNEEGMIVWRDPNVKRWDGGPTGAGTAWNNPENWRPNGVPLDIHDIVIDYSLMWVDYDTSPSPTLRVPNLNIDMNYDYTSSSSSSGKSLTINPRILPRIPSGTAITEPIEINIQRDFRIGGTVAIGDQGTIEVTDPDALIEVGENWSNNGSFINGGGVVKFYKNASRTISNVLSGKDATNNLTSDLNSFNNLILDEGNTDLSTDIFVKGNLSIETNATFNANNRFIYIERDWINKGTFRPSNSTVYFRGNDIQRVVKIPSPMPTDSRSIKEDFFNMVVNTQGDSRVLGSTNNVYLANRVEVLDGGRLSLINGRVVAEDNQEMIISEFATLDGPPSENSFVQGPAGRVFSSSSVKTTLAFPIGSEEAGKTASFEVQTIDADGGITALSINNAGEGYVIGNRILIGNSTGTGAVITVASVNGTGGITGFTYTQAGEGYTVGDAATVADGQGSPVYVGNSLGSVALQEMTLSNDRKTMFVSEQIEEPAPGSRLLPTTSPINYISRERHWTIRNLPYVTSGLIDTANNAEMEETKVLLWFDANDEVIEGQNATGIIADLNEARVMMDSRAPYSAASGTTAGYSPNTSAEHDRRLRRGIAYQSSYWKDTQGGDIIDAPAKAIVSDFIDSLNDGTFTLGFNYLLLPLEIIDLSARKIGEDVLVQWITANEIDSKYFVIQRGKDGELFEELGKVDALGTTNNSRGIRNYEFLDKNPHQGWNYYRLQQVSHTGEIDTSPVVSVQITKEGALLVYPNPMPRNALLNIRLPQNIEAEMITLTLVDMQGRVIYQNTIPAEQINEPINLGGNLTEGVYILKIDTKYQHYQTKLLVNSL